jgi:hypothetical protein
MRSTVACFIVQYLVSARLVERSAANDSHAMALRRQAFTLYLTERHDAKKIQKFKSGYRHMAAFGHFCHACALFTRS